MTPENIRVLVVDDMPSLRSLLKTHLRKMGYKEILEAANGQEAYQSLIASKSSGTPCGLIISDWNMPTMDGLELLKAVKGNADFKKVPFILLTTESEKGKVMEAVMAGVTNYVVKPIEEETLKEKLDAIWAKMAKES